MSRQSPPGEEDLQHLYNEVWAGFLEEEPGQRPQRSNTVSTAGEMESIYGAYGDDDDQSKLSGRVPSIGASISCGCLVLVYSECMLTVYDCSCCRGAVSAARTFTRT